MMCLDEKSKLLISIINEDINIFIESILRAFKENFNSKEETLIGEYLENRIWIIREGIYKLRDYLWMNKLCTKEYKMFLERLCYLIDEIPVM